MKFRISREKTINWPNKCVCCGDKSTTRYTAVGRGYFVPRFQLFGIDEFYFERVAVKYPVCRKHYNSCLGMQIACFGSIAGITLNFIISTIPMLFGVFEGINVLLYLIFSAMFIFSKVLRPVRLRWVRRDFYTMIIRNDDYANEFAMLNGLSPT